MFVLNHLNSKAKSHAHHLVYKSYGSDTISIVPIVVGDPYIMTANLEVAKQVIGGGVKSPYFKPEEMSQALL